MARRSAPEPPRGGPARLGGAAILLVAGSLAAALTLSACGGSSGSAKATKSAAGSRPGSTALAPIRSTPASRQLAWVIGEISRGRAPSTASLEQHFSKAFLTAVPPKQLIDALTPLAAQGPLELAGALASQSELALRAEVSARAGATFRATISVSPAPPHLIEGLLLTPLASPITSWSGVDRALEGLAAHASLYAAAAGGGVVHALDGDRAGAIGSAFKLYVLGALAAAVERGSVSWTTQLAIRDSWKSLPSGDMRLEPAGTRFSLLHYAQQMISVSDNTAADHLIGRLGRAAVEAQLVALGNHSVSRNEPFLTTRELFALKLAAPQSLRDAFAAAGSAERTRLLARVDALTPTVAQADSWTAPRSIATIEWFASPSDLAHAITTLVADSQRPRLSPLGEILAINPGVELDHETWPYVAFKGGSEPGVLSLTWYLRRHDGRAFVLSIVLNDPSRAISTFATVSVAEAAINLLAHV